MPENDPNLPKLLAELGVAAWELPPAAIRQMHAHSHIEAQLCGLDAGLAIMETDKGSWLCPPGRCIWIPSGTVHSLHSCGKMSGWMLHMDAELSDALPPEPRVLALTPLLKVVVRRIAEWAAEPEVSAAKQRLIEVLKDEISAASQVALHLPIPHDPALKRLAERLASRSEYRNNLVMLAHESGLSERSLFRNFQQETGMSPGQWRRQAQVLRSLELLANGMSVTQTSLEVGYESTGAFIRAFRQLVGETPATYAKQQRLGPRPNSHMHALHESL
jgi:AraC-like DNA-binding protein